MYGVEGVTDHATDEVQKEPHELVTDPVGANTEGFPGVLHHTLVLTSYADHVTARVWAWEVVIYLIITYLNKYLSF